MIIPMHVPVVSQIPIVTQALNHPAEKIAVIDGDGSHTYAQLLKASQKVAFALLDGKTDLRGERVAFLVPSGFIYPAVQWGIWRAGGIAVPLCILHPTSELKYVIEDSDASVVIAHPEFAERVRPIAKALGRRFILTTACERDVEGDLPVVEADRSAMILYTSGTTSKPKGVVTTHHNIAAQIQSLVQAWKWNEEDRILLFLPLHHIHGILNILCCALWAGATCEMQSKFDVDVAWQKIRSGKLTLFMAVPTVYVRLMKAWDAASEEERATMSRACGKLRLMVSGSAALPVSTLEEWKKISGHTLLERYGMTEIGMALSNPLNGERRPGHVGSPLPGVEVRLADEANVPMCDGEPGEIQVRGDTVFKEYWRRPDATKKSFTQGGWFKTGDIAIRSHNIYRILGRNSVDIIKTGGYKVSALEIEEILLSHPAIDQCAVVGISDPEWGERVSAVGVLKSGESLDLESLRAWAKEFLAIYKIPSQLLIVEELPRNAMGKVVKPEVAKLFHKEASSILRN